YRLGPKVCREEPSLRYSLEATLHTRRAIWSLSMAANRKVSKRLVSAFMSKLAVTFPRNAFYEIGSKESKVDRKTKYAANLGDAFLALTLVMTRFVSALRLSEMRLVSI
ncbi:hypothetical protein WG66_016159, partial [Moniliophthora roreri]